MGTNPQNSLQILVLPDSRTPTLVKHTDLVILTIPWLPWLQTSWGSSGMKGLLLRSKCIDRQLPRSSYWQYCVMITFRVPGMTPSHVFNGWIIWTSFLSKFKPLWIKQVVLFIYWASMSELLLIILTCESTLLAVEYWFSLTLLAAIFIPMGLMVMPFQAEPLLYPFG